MTHRQTNQKQWERRLRDQAKSGLSEREYCRARRLAHHTFRYWRMKLPKAKASEAERRGVRSKEFVRVEVEPSVRVLTSQSTVVRLSGGMTIESESWPDPKWLAELNMVMGAAR